MRAAAIMLAGCVAAPQIASAENLFDFLFGGLQKEMQQPAERSLFVDPSAGSRPASPSRQIASGGSGPAFCVRSCDGKYFPIPRGNATPVQTCQAFCPASATKVFYGSAIDSAASTSGERYADSENAYAYRKALRADCTCNGRDPAGLAPVDLTMDTSLRRGDMIATTNGLVAYSGARAGDNQAAEFTPVASYPGLAADTRAQLSSVKIAPVRAETIADQTQPPVAASPKSALANGTRAEMD
jgi:Protein of unknown function (DUF2865)